MTNTQDRTLVTVEQIDVPLSFYEWLGSIERDTLVHDLTPHEQRALCAALASAPDTSGRGEVERLVGLLRSSAEGLVEVKADARGMITMRHSSAALLARDCEAAASLLAALTHTPTSDQGERLREAAETTDEVARLRESETELTEIKASMAYRHSLIGRTTSEVARLREALETIRNGDEPRPVGDTFRCDGKPSKHDKCVHNVWMYEYCGGCVMEFARAALKQEQK
jgi:hypothetical protein